MHPLLAVPLLMLSFGECEHVNATATRGGEIFPPTISVKNGQMWGEWGKVEKCPSGTFARGFSLKVEPKRGVFRDDTALNAIALYCAKSNSSAGGFTTIKSTEGSFGSWREDFWCSNGVLTAFQLRVEGKQGWKDDTAANNIQFRCSDGEVLEGDGLSWGVYGSWSSVCGGTGICGMKTKVQPPQGGGDDTSLNDVVFTCC